MEESPAAIRYFDVMSAFFALIDSFDFRLQQSKIAVGLMKQLFLRPIRPTISSGICFAGDSKLRLLN